MAGQYLGAKNEERARRVSDQLILLIFLISAVVTAALFFLRGVILRTVFGSITQEVMGYADTYLTITLFSIPFIALYNGGAAIFRTMADSRTPMLISFLMNAVNISGNALLIYGLGWEIEGAAIPTLLSRIVAAVVVLLLLRREKYSLHFSRPFRLPGWKGGTVKRILGIGIPNGIENAMFQFGKIMVVSLISSFGTVAITANAVSNAIGGFPDPARGCHRHGGGAHHLPLLRRGGKTGALLRPAPASPGILLQHRHQPGLLPGHSPDPPALPPDGRDRGLGQLGAAAFRGGQFPPCGPPPSCSPTCTGPPVT